MPAASVVDAIKRPKQFVECFRRHAGTRVRNLNDSFRSIRSLPALQADLHVRAFARVLDCIANHIFDRTAQQRRISNHHAVIHLGYVDTTFAALSFEVGVLRNFADQLLQADGDFLHGLIAAFKARNRQQSPNQLVQAIGFELDAFQRALSFGSTSLAAQSQRYVQTREWGSQFVRNIIQ